MRSLLSAGKVLALAGLIVGLTAVHAQVPALPAPTVPAGTGDSTTNTTPDAAATQTSQQQQTQQVEMLDYSVPPQAPVTPNIDDEIVNSSDVYTIHLRPLYTTGIRLPEEVTSIAVGAPTLIAAEHDKNEPKLIFVKPTTDSPIDSNVIVVLKSGETLAIHVISAGDKGSDDPVDFMVDYSQSRSLLRGNSQSSLIRGARDATPDGPHFSQAPPQDNVVRRNGPVRGTTPDALNTEVTDSTPVAMNEMTSHMGKGREQVVRGSISEARTPDTIEVPATLLEAAFKAQVEVGAPHFTSGPELAHLYPEDANATGDLEVSLGRVVQLGDTMTFSFSVMNKSHRWIEIMPPLLQFNDPNGNKNAKQNKKHPTSLAEQLPVDDYVLSSQRLAPGQRVDGAVQFQRPDFKYKKQTLMLQIASASEVDTALLVPVPFIAAKGD